MRYVAEIRQEMYPETHSDCPHSFSSGRCAITGHAASPAEAEAKVRARATRDGWAGPWQAKVYWLNARGAKLTDELGAHPPFVVES